MAATASSMAATAVLIPRFSSISGRSSASPFLPPCPISPFSPASIKLSSVFVPFSSESRGRSRSSMLKIRASYSDEASPVDTSEIFNDLKAKWDGVENKSTVLLYGGGAIVAVWLSSIIVGAINSVPLLPKIMELVGLGYTGWFVYRYLLFKSSRKELAADVKTLKKKIAGTE